ncbi:hypothetical protein K438DRAFT_1876738 [Mycena galopus ATCC 62051]|nr:hypothetical protein K438DRAFT_1876738 [Mycena galopus ATCC 62051]
MTLGRYHSEVETFTFATFFAMLRHYCNLSSLHVGFATIDLGAELHFRNCVIAAAEAFLRIDALKMINCLFPPSHSIRLASPQILRTLDVALDISHVISGFGSNMLSTLMELSLQDVDDTRQLFQFLAQCPRLQLLVIGFLELPLLPVPPSIIPCLRDLTAPPDVCNNIWWQALQTRHHASVHGYFTCYCTSAVAQLSPHGTVARDPRRHLLIIPRTEAVVFETPGDPYILLRRRL